MLIAAQYSGAQIKIADDFVFGETNKSEAFLKKFPLGKVNLLHQHYFHRFFSYVTQISGKPAGMIFRKLVLNIGFTSLDFHSTHFNTPLLAT